MTSHAISALAVIGIALLVAAFGAYKTRRSWRLRNALKGASQASAGSLRPREGPVELQGTAHAAEHSFISPLTRQECVAYRFIKEERQRTQKRRQDHFDDDEEWETRIEYEWETIHDEEAGAPFYVDDGTGRTLVDGSTADLDMDRSYRVDTEDVKRGVGEKIVASVKGLVGSKPVEEDHEIPQEYVDEIRSAGNSRRYFEWVVNEGEEVYVYGEAVDPEQTPLGSGLDGGVSTGVEALRGGLLTSVRGMVGLATEVVSDPRSRYKPRAVQRLPTPDTDEAQEETQDSDLRRQADQLAEQFGGMAKEEIRDEPGAAGRMQDQMADVAQQAKSTAERALPDTPALDRASVVVSWGERAPTFVVSDQGKGSVVRDYSTGVFRYGLLTLAAAGAVVGAFAWLIGLV